MKLETAQSPATVVCPDCRARYPRSPLFRHVCPAGARTFYYWLRMKDDHIVEVAVLEGAVEDDPLLRVETLAPDGTLQRWAMRRRNGRLYFYPPDGYAGGQPLALHYSKEIQRHRMAPRHVMEREALGGRVSVGF